MEISGTQNISDMINSAIKEHEQQNNAANYTVEVRGEIKVLPIINLRTNCVTLNHNNNRLAAQLKDYPNASELMENPTSVETQKILAELLASTDKFSKLKRELEEQGQIDPGLITRDGLLVNGNTRAAALLQLSHIERAKGIKVAVLPPGIGEDDILDFIDTDLTCYRAEKPNDLVQWQSKNWDPILLKVENYINNKINVFKGIMPLKQDKEIHIKISKFLTKFTDL